MIWVDLAMLAAPAIFVILMVLVDGWGMDPYMFLMAATVFGCVGGLYFVARGLWWHYLG